MTCISIACNHPDNGHFMGHFDAVHYGDDQDMELQQTMGSRPFAIRFLDDSRVRIRHRIFKYTWDKEWFGNWCWHGFRMERSEARRLLRYLRESGLWHCEGGPTRLYYWFNQSHGGQHG
jgi:hypothetical protein